MSRSSRSANLPRSARRYAKFNAPTAADPAVLRFDLRPTGAEAVTSGAPAPIAADVTPSQDAASGREALDAEWQHVWDTAPEAVRYAFETSLRRLWAPRPILFDNLLPGVERRVEALLALHARRLGPPSRGGK